MRQNRGTYSGNIKIGIFCILVVFFIHAISIEGDTENVQLPVQGKKKIERFLRSTANAYVHTDSITIDSAKVISGRLQLFADENLSYIPFNKRLTDSIYECIKEILPADLKNDEVELYSDGYKIEDYIPFSRKERFTNRKVIPLIEDLSRPYSVKRGLQNRYIAMWQSHGWYYNTRSARWEWQRARILQTVEDLYTQSYVLPYLVPMLENAGATVFLPRERDFQKNEIIIDNDPVSSKSEYKEIVKGREGWENGKGDGFANPKKFYLDGENPFRMGTYRQTGTVTGEKDNRCEWIPDIPERGRYAVYISYKSLKNSTDDAHYSVYHLGGRTDFSINQTMGGGTWIFLGFFSFDKGKNENGRIVLSNKSRKGGRTVTADAVKIGGGMGNMARMPSIGNPSDTAQSFRISYLPETSGRPRYTEGARYWLHWAGIPDSIYNTRKSSDDYTDDYHCRGLWVNYLAGGSEVLPGSTGLNLPIDLSLAFHSDAGVTYNDSIIGTLGICMTHLHDEKFADGKPRILSRDLTTSVMNEIIRELRSTYAPEWTRRALLNRSYSEARVPEVPSMLLEILSHENLSDMRYGTDPRFRFTVSRAVYKGILKFLSYQYKEKYIVQPLPVEAFSAVFTDNDHVRLSWKAKNDKLEPTAEPDFYIVYKRTEKGDFDKGTAVHGTHARIPILKDQIYSFKITAVNKGGESFPSEILSVCKKSNEKGTVLVVNGFDRLSAPYSFALGDSLGGFVDAIDHGVPDKMLYNYTGSQFEFRRKLPWTDNDAPGFGASNADYETSVIAGNTFDYPFVHGESIVKAGYSFVSAARDAVTDSTFNWPEYKLMDLILGKQRQTKIGRGTLPAAFKTFPDILQDRITLFCKQGGSIFVSGAFVGSDLWNSEKPNKRDLDFAMNILHYKWRTGQAAVDGQVESVPSPFGQFSGNYEFYQHLNSLCYSVESPDAIEANGKNAYTVFRYKGNNMSAGIASDLRYYKTCILGFPFETIENSIERDTLMKDILNFMSGK